MNCSAFLVGLAVLLCLPTMAYCQPTSKTCSLTVLVADPEGVDLPAGTLTIISADGKLDRSERIEKSLTVELPYGQYSLSFRSPLLTTITRTAVLDQSALLVVLATTIDPENLHLRPSSHSLSIQLHPARVCSNMSWAKLSAIFIDYSMEQRINPSGMALFDGVPAGLYTLAIVDGRSVRGMRIVDVRGPLTVTQVDVVACEK